MKLSPVRPRILVVDDNAINRRLAMAFVKRLGFVTEEVEDGASALEWPLRAIFVARRQAYGGSRSKADRANVRQRAAAA